MKGKTQTPGQTGPGAGFMLQGTSSVCGLPARGRPFELFIQKDFPRPRALSHLHSHPRPPILREGCCPCAPLRFNPTCDAPLPVFVGVARRSPELASACSGPGWAGRTCSRRWDTPTSADLSRSQHPARTRTQPRDSGQGGRQRRKR